MGAQLETRKRRVQFPIHLLGASMHEEGKTSPKKGESVTILLPEKHLRISLKKGSAAKRVRGRSGDDKSGTGPGDLID